MTKEARFTSGLFLWDGFTRLALQPMGQEFEPCEQREHRNRKSNEPDRVPEFAPLLCCALYRALLCSRWHRLENA